MINNKIKRLLRYRQCLLKFEELGFEKAFSHMIAKELGISSEQVRKDFSEFGIKGNKRGGYEIASLIDTICNIFSQNGNRKAVIVGMGNIGRAIASYKGFKKQNIYIVASFDIDPSKLKNNLSIPIFKIDELASYIKFNNIKTAILSVPEVSARSVCRILIENGITGILNFTASVLKVPENVIVNNIYLTDELESIFYYTNKNY